MGNADRGQATVRVQGIEGEFQVEWWREPAGHMTFRYHHPNINEWEPHERFRLLAEIAKQIVNDPRYRG